MARALLKKGVDDEVIVERRPRGVFYVLSVSYDGPPA